MKLGKPTGIIPRDSRSRDYGKYAKIYAAIDKLSDDEWLPVIFDTVKYAYNFRCAVETHRTRLMEAKQRKAVVYVRNKQVSTSAKQRGGRS